MHMILRSVPRSVKCSAVDPMCWLLGENSEHTDSRLPKVATIWRRAKRFMSKTHLMMFIFPLHYNNVLSSLLSLYTIKSPYIQLNEIKIYNFYQGAP